MRSVNDSPEKVLKDIEEYNSKYKEIIVTYGDGSSKAIDFIHK